MKPLVMEVLVGILTVLCAAPRCVFSRCLRLGGRRNKRPREYRTTRRGVCLGLLVIVCVVLATYKLGWYRDLRGYSGPSCALTDAEIARMERLFRANAETAAAFSLRTYSLDGTLLGAVREGGIIRFDQDMDVGMDARQEFIPQDPYVTKNFLLFIQDMVREPSAEVRQRKLEALPPIARHLTYMGYIDLRGVHDGGNRNVLFIDKDKFFDPVHGSMYGSPVRYEMVSFRCDNKAAFLVHTHDPLTGDPNCVQSQVASISAIVFEGREAAEAARFPTVDRLEADVVPLAQATDSPDWGEGGIAFWKLRNLADRSFFQNAISYIGSRIAGFRTGEVTRTTLLQVPPRGTVHPLPNRSRHDAEFYPQFPLTVMWMNFLRVIASEEGARMLPYVGGDYGLEKLFKVEPSCVPDYQSFKSAMQSNYHYKMVLMYPFFMAQHLFYHASRKSYNLPSTLDLAGAFATYENHLKRKLDWERYPTPQDVLRARDWVRNEGIVFDHGFPEVLQEYLDHHQGAFMRASDCKDACCPKPSFSDRYPTWHDAMIDLGVVILLGSSPSGGGGLDCLSLQQIVEASGFGSISNSTLPLELDSVLGGPAISRNHNGSSIDVCGGSGFNDNGWINIASKGGEPVRFTGVSPQHPMTAPFRTYFAYELPYFPFDYRLRNPPSPQFNRTSTATAGRRIIPTGTKPAMLHILVPLNVVQFLDFEYSPLWRTPVPFKPSCFIPNSQPADDAFH